MCLWFLWTALVNYFLKDFIYLFIFRERRREGEREGGKQQCVVASLTLLGTWPATQACALTENWIHDHWFCRLALNPLSHTSQGCSSKLIRPGRKLWEPPIYSSFIGQKHMWQPCLMDDIWSGTGRVGGQFHGTEPISCGICAISR